MKLLDFLHITEKRKMRKPMVMYHGTSDKHLRSILKHGVVPTPSGRVWATDEFISQHDFSRVSLEGSYWTSNLMTVFSSATNAISHFGGNRLLVIAQIAEASAYADEDSVTFAIRRTLPAMYDEITGKSIVTPDAAAKITGLSYFTGGSWYQELQPKEMLEVYTRILHNSLAKDPDKEPVNVDLMRRMMEAHMMRQLAYSKEYESEKFYKDPYVKEMERLGQEGKVPLIPSLEEIEQEIKKIQDLLTKKYTKTAFKSSDSFSHTLRITEPVTFRGANKILSIMMEMPKLTSPYVLYYGIPPNDFFQQYKEQVGLFPGAVNTRGEMVIEPNKEVRESILNRS